VIPNHYPEVIVPLLKSLGQFPVLGARVIIIADGHDNDYGFEAIRYPDEKFVFAKAVNLGVRALGRQDVVLLNDDCILIEPRPFQRLEEIAQLSSQIGILSPLIKGCVGNSIQRWHERDRFWQSREVIHFAMGKEPICFPCVYIKRTVFDAIGLLSESFTGYGGEDNDFCIKCRAVGILTAATSRVVVQHGNGGPELQEGRGKTWSVSFARKEDEYRRKYY